MHISQIFCIFAQKFNNNLIIIYNMTEDVRQKLEGFYNEDVLDELLEEGKITNLDYIYHHSEEMKSNYAEYCGEDKLEQNEETAGAFLAKVYEEREKSLMY